MRTSHELRGETGSSLVGSSSGCTAGGHNSSIGSGGKTPISSFGIIAFRYNSYIDDIQYLMILRKNSFGYIDFIRGKFVESNYGHICQLINEMSNDEKENVLTKKHEELATEMWGVRRTTHAPWRGDENGTQKKFDRLNHTGIQQGNQYYKLPDMIRQSPTSWEETEWEFPKGRKNHQESDLDCAVREFCEETGYSIQQIELLQNVLPFEEIFIGSNHKSYRHKYFLARIKDDRKEIDISTFQQAEVKKAEWKTYQQCFDAIRPYSVEKRRIINSVNKLLLNRYPVKFIQEVVIPANIMSISSSTTTTTTTTVFSPSTK